VRDCDCTLCTGHATGSLLTSARQVFASPDEGGGSPALASGLSYVEVWLAARRPPCSSTSSGAIRPSSLFVLPAGSETHPTA